MEQAKLSLKEKHASVRAQCKELVLGCIRIVDAEIDNKK